MIGGDVVVAWVDKQTLQGYAIDYFLDAKSQCSGHRGSCPDNRILVLNTLLKTNIRIFCISQTMFYLKDIFHVCSLYTFIVSEI